MEIGDRVRVVGSEHRGRKGEVEEFCRYCGTERLVKVRLFPTRLHERITQRFLESELEVVDAGF